MKFIALALILFLSGCKETYTWYQTTTVTIDTPEGPVSGQGVVGISLRIIQRQTVTGGFLKWRYWGESAVVDLGDGKYVFALLTRPRGGWQPDVLVRSAFKRAGIVPHLGRSNGREWYRSMTDHGRPVELIPEEYPTLVAFRDLAEPASIVELANDDDFLALFGAGYRLSGVTLEVSESSEMAPRILEVLPWLDGHLGAFTNHGEPCETPCRGDGRYLENPPFGDFVGHLHFVRQLK